MPANFNADEFDTALRQLEPARLNSPAGGVRVGHPALDEWQQSQEFKVRVISSRTKLKLMRDRSESLRDSLQRFREQQACANRA